ncbi:MAG: porphobilinogen synthase [Bdellovibrionales bacterium]|nr:porphobilinogen synthase [Bdellovibrionales bacterium]
MNITERPRRLRRSQAVRDLVQETRLSASDLIWPVFIKEGRSVKEPITALPGCNRMSVDVLLSEIERLLPLGLKAIALFPAIDDKLKNSKAQEALNPSGLVPRAVRDLKTRFPELCVITDVALDPYSSDGHDGIVKEGEVLNDETLVLLAEQAKVHAEAGADFVAPSDMMDGRVGWIRKQLDEAGFQRTGIISYCAKYASGFYGPFREALASAPRFGDKKTYQMNPMNRREARREARLDRSEGADILMVKPALSYLDVIREVRAVSDLPVAAYNVSGEYAMIKAAGAQGWLDESTVTLEVLGSIKRAGADMIFSYHTPDVLHWLD